MTELPAHSLPIPRQARSRAALDRFLETGERLVAEGRFEEASITEIAHEADSSVGTFYRLIRDKDQLLRAVHDRFVASGRAAIRAHLEPARFVDAELEVVLEAFVRLLVDLYAEREGMLRALIVRASTDVEFRQRIHALRDETRTSLGALVLPRAHQIRHPRPLEAFAFGVKVVVGMLNHATVVQSLEPEATDDMVRELTRVLVRYLEIE